MFRASGSTNFEVGYGENVGSPPDGLGYLGEQKVKKVSTEQLSTAVACHLCSKAERIEYWNLLES